VRGNHGGNKIFRLNGFREAKAVGRPRGSALIARIRNRRRGLSDGGGDSGYTLHRIDPGREEWNEDGPRGRMGNWKTKEKTRWEVKRGCEKGVV